VPKVPRFNGGVDACANSNAMQSKSLSLSARVLRACLPILVNRGLRAHSSVDAARRRLKRLGWLRSDLRFLELGRSCVLPPYRTKRTVELLWHGIWSYVLEHRSDVMIGCASFEGTDPERLALPLVFLHHYARAPEPWRTSALPRLSAKAGACLCVTTVCCGFNA
jgi:putative hemolysin